jgi:hypothetical protein
LLQQQPDAGFSFHLYLRAYWFVQTAQKSSEARRATKNGLLPGTVLPLHVFEPRYRNMVEDALAADKIIGMIQPVAPRQDNRSPLPGAERETPGSVGVLEYWSVGS